jgi:hypothetical protein
MKKLILAALSIFMPVAVYGAVTVYVNGTPYAIPQKNERGWGDAVTSWIQGISSNTLQPSGGPFTLTGEVDFGASYGLKSIYYKSRASNAASLGVLRLANSDSIAWRNATNASDMQLIPGADGVLNYSGVQLIGASLTQTLTNKTIDADSNTISNIEDTDIKSGANIAVAKLAAVTADRALVSDGSGKVSPSSVTATELGYVSGVTSSVQTQLNGKQATGNYVTSLTGDVTASGPGAAATTIANGAVNNAKVASDAAIAWTKLDKSGSNLTDIATRSHTSLSDIGTNTHAQIDTHVGSTSNPHSTTADQVLPTQTGNNGKYLTTNGTTSSWGTVDALPTQTGNAGKYLSTNGTLASWEMVEAGEGGSSGINYIENSDLEDGVTGYTAYLDADQATPVDGVGAGSTVSIVPETTTPLRGSSSLLFAKGTGDKRGQGFRYDFTIDRADEAKVLSVKFDYAITSAAGTYSDGDLTVWIYDLDNNQMLQPAPSSILNVVGKGTWAGTFQTNVATAGADARKYRLIFHVTSESAAAYTVAFDQISCGPQSVTYGAPVTDEENTGAVTIDATANPTKGTVVVDRLWKSRVGDKLKLRLEYVQSGAGSTGTGTYFFKIPSGLTIDTAKAAASTIAGAQTTVGIASAINGGNKATGNVTVADSTHLALHLTYGSTGSFGGPGFVGSAFFGLGSTGQLEISFTAEVPILGWSSSTVMSDVAKSAPTIQKFLTGSGTYTTPNGVKYLRVRMVGGGGGGFGGGVGGAAGGAGSDTTFGTSLLTASGGGAGGGSAGGTGGGYTINAPAIGFGIRGGSGGGSIYTSTATAPSGGVGGNSAFGGGGPTVNNANSPIPSDNSGAGGGGGGVGGAGAAGTGGGGGAGGYVDVIIPNPGLTYAYSVGTTSAGGAAGSYGYVGGQGAGGIIIVEEYYRSEGITAASEEVSEIWQSNANSAPYNSQDTLIMASAVKSTHGAYNATTGVFTAPIAGTYDIFASIATNAYTATSAAGEIILLAYKNGTSTLLALSRIPAYTTAASVVRNVTCSAGIPLLAGDTVRFRVFQNMYSSGAMGFDNGSPEVNRLEFKRRGGVM